MYYRGIIYMLLIGYTDGLKQTILSFYKVIE